MKNWLFNEANKAGGGGGPKGGGDEATGGGVQASNPRQVFSAFAKKMDPMALFEAGANNPSNASSSSSGSGNAAMMPSGKQMSSAMENFFVALQTDLEQGLDEIKGSSAQLGARIREMREKSNPGSASAAGTLGPEEVAQIEATKERLASFKVVQLGEYHNCTITAIAADRVVKTSDEDKYVTLEWYRATPGGSFTEIKGIKGGTYHPSADDIGARICVRASVQHVVRSDDDIPFSVFAEVGPLKIDPVVELECTQNLETSTVRFPWLIDYQNKTQICGLHLSTEAVSLHTLDRPPGDDLPGLETEGQLVGEGPWSADLKVVLDPCGVALLALQVPRVVQDGPGPALMKKILMCPTREMRDVVVLTWRHYRDIGLPGTTVSDDLDVVFHQEVSPTRRTSLTKSISNAINKAAAMTRGNDDASTDGPTSPVLDDKEVVLFRRPTHSSSNPPRSVRPIEERPSQQIPERRRLPRARFEEILSRHKRAAKEQKVVEKVGLRRVSSDTCLHIVAASSPSSSFIAHALDPNHDSRAQIDNLMSEVHDLRADLEAKEIQLVKLSEEVGSISIDLAKVNSLRVEEQKQLEVVTNERNTLLLECNTFKTLVANAQEDAAKHDEHLKRLEMELDEMKIHKMSLEDELERVTISEQALSLKMCTNETAVTLMREEVGALQAKMAELQQEKESERTYFVSNLHDKEQKLEKADQAVIDIEAKLTSTNKSNAKLQEQVAALEAEIGKLRAELSQCGSTIQDNSNRHEELQAQEQQLKEQHEQALKSQEQELQATEKARETLAAQLREMEDKVQKLERSLDEESRRTTSLVGERNAYKNKAESLSREMHRLGRGRSLDEIDNVVSKHQDIQAQLAVAKAENKRLLDENEEYRVALASSKDMLAKKTQGTAAARAMEQHSELQRVNQLLTESLNDKVLQLETQRGMNRKMIHRMELLQKKLTSLGQAIDDDEDDEDDEEDDEDER